MERQVHTLEANYPAKEAFSAAAIGAYLPERPAELLRYFDSIDSTNTYLKQTPDLPHGTVAVADSQSGGRGRRGRQFESAGGQGIYLSVVWQASLFPGDLLSLTALGAVAACNAVETLLVHSAEVKETLPVVAKALAEAGVRLIGDARAAQVIACEAATEADWAAEYLDDVIAIHVVDSLQEAIAHINRYGSHHTDGIITENEQAAKTFFALVDSAGVYHNCSTRFADGFRYGFGAEVGISTGKIHARGPMGLEGLCSYKYILRGSGDIVADFAQGRRFFTHKKLL